MTYPEIQNLFGSPLSQVSIPHVPFKFETWQKIAIAIILLLAIYGAYCLYQDLKNKMENKATGLQQDL